MNDLLSTTHGVVIFDNADQPALGWASLAGEEPRRIHQIADLESDGVFISNLSWQQLRSINALKEPRLRVSNFFREDMYIIAQDLGLPIFEDPQSCLSTVSEFFDRSIRLASDIYGFSRIAGTLKESIYTKLFPKGEPTTYGTPKIDEAFNEAYLAIQKCYISNLNSSRSAKLRFSRPYFASMLMRFPIPIGPWTIYQGKLPKNIPSQRKGENSQVYQFLKEFGEKKPALCQVSVKNIDIKCGALLGFTNGTEGRSWVPIQEAAFLSTIADVTIKKMIEGTSYKEFSDVSYGWHEQSAVGDVSYSLGLVAEAHIAAITSATRKPSGGSIYSPRAVFLKSWDRILLFKTAYSLHQQDICVRSYAMGAINVSIEDYQLEFVAKASLECSMTPPLWLINASNVDQELGISGNEGNEGNEDIKARLTDFV
jgi:hypothetical protein